MTFRRILDVIADVLTLLALAIAGFGHFLPWFEIREQPFGRTDVDFHTAAPADAGGVLLLEMEPPDTSVPPIDFQMWHAARSGIALAVAALLVGVSLVLNLGVGARKLLVFLMFVSVMVAVSFQVMIFTPYPITEIHRQFADSKLYQLDGHLLALIPSIIAGVFCLARMGWTMTAPSNVKGPRLGKGPPGNEFKSPVTDL